MTANRTLRRAVVHGWGWFSPFGLVLFCGAMLLSQAGCQEGSSTATSPALAQEPEKIAAPAPAERDDEPQPAEGVVKIQTPQVVANVPKLVFDSTTDDFGEVGPQGKYTAEFTFRNAGDAPLKITRVQGCCGVQIQGIAAGQQYAPGKGSTAKLTYTAGTYPSPVTKQVRVETNDPVQPITTLTVKGKIVQRIALVPQRLRLFLKQENAGCGELKLNSLDGQPFAITSVMSTANAITAAFDPNVKATEFVLKPQVDMERLQRNLRGQISINLTHPECPNLRVWYDVLPEFTINPPQITLLYLKPNQAVQREIWILSNYLADFEIESTTSDKGLIKVLDSRKIRSAMKDWSSDPPGERMVARYQLKIEVTPPAMEGERTVLTDTLHINIKDGGELAIECQGFYSGS